MLKNISAEIVKQLLTHQTFMSAQEVRSNTMREYQKYEFCKAIKCPSLKDNICNIDPEVCLYSAKEFHIWIKENNFKIVKDNKYDLSA